VYDAVQDLMQRDIHALALTLVTAAEVRGTGSQTNT
jgi:stress-induced morphogen